MRPVPVPWQPSLRIELFPPYVCRKNSICHTLAFGSTCARRNVSDARRSMTRRRARRPSMPVEVPARPRANGGTTTEAGTTINVFPSVSPPAFLSLGVGSALPQEYHAMNRRARKPQKNPGLCECAHALYIPDISTLLLVVVCLVRIHASFLLRRGDGDYGCVCVVVVKRR